MSIPSHECRFAVFRHGETDWNRDQRIQGQLDVPLNERGREQARALVQALGPLELRFVLSSDLARARETAEIVARALDLKVILDSRLREAHLGQAQGLLWTEAEKRFGHEVSSRWLRGLRSDADACFPDGESTTRLLARVFELLSLHGRANPGSRIGVATHGGVIRRLVRAVLEDDRHVAIPNTVVYELRFDTTRERWSLVDTADLRSAEGVG